MFFNWSTNRWHQVDSMKNMPQGNIVSVNNRIFVCNDPRSSESYSPGTNSWTPVYGIPCDYGNHEENAHGFTFTSRDVQADSACQMDGLIHFYFTDKGIRAFVWFPFQFMFWLFLVSVSVYDPVDEKVETAIPSVKRYDVLLSSVNNRLLITGGSESKDNSQPTSTAWMYNDQVEVCSDWILFISNHLLLWSRAGLE